MNKKQYTKQKRLNDQLLGILNANKITLNKHRKRIVD